MGATRLNGTLRRLSRPVYLYPWKYGQLLGAVGGADEGRHVLTYSRCAQMRAEIHPPINRASCQ